MSSLSSSVANREQVSLAGERRRSSHLSQAQCGRDLPKNSCWQQLHFLLASNQDQPRREGHASKWSSWGQVPAGLFRRGTPRARACTLCSFALALVKVPLGPVSNMLKAFCCTPPIWKTQWSSALVASGPLEQVASVPFLLGFSVIAFLSPIWVLSSLNPCSLIPWSCRDCCWVSSLIITVQPLSSQTESHDKLST